MDHVHHPWSSLLYSTIVLHDKALLKHNPFDTAALNCHVVHHVRFLINSCDSSLIKGLNSLLLS